MFADDIRLVEEAVAKHGPVALPYVEVGGSETPTIADYSRTIEAMAALKGRTFYDGSIGYQAAVADAQLLRFLKVHRPLDQALPGYICTDPHTGGLSIEDLPKTYRKVIGCLVALSVLEHCLEPWYAPEFMHEAVKPGGLVIVSVPWQFPTHEGPTWGDHWRFSPSGLRKLFESPKDGWDVLWCGPRLAIDADAGVLNTQNGKPQAIYSSALIARAR